MPVKVRIPSPLRGLTQGQGTVEAQGNTISEVLLNLDAKFPGIREKLYDKATLRPIFGIFLNSEDIRALNKDEGRYELKVDEPVRDGDELSIVPPIAGGMEGGRRGVRFLSFR